MTTNVDATGPVIDLRALVPAEAARRALLRAGELAPGGVAVLLLPALAASLLPVLGARGLQVRMDRLPEGARLNIRRLAAPRTA